MAYRIGIVGVTGAVGQELLALLAKRRFPVAELRPLASARSAGRKVAFGGKDWTVQEARPEAFEGPQAAHAGSDRLGRIGGPLLEHRHERRRLAIDDLLPREVGDPGVGRAEMPGQLFRRELAHGHGLVRRL